MANKNFSTDLVVITVNGRQINDWGNSDPPYQDAQIDPSSTLRRGLGGTGVRFDRINPGRSVTLSLQPGSPDSAYLQGLLNSKSNITITKTIIGTLENAIGTEGVIIGTGSTGRGGPNFSDDVFNLEFNGWTEMKGGK